MAFHGLLYGVIGILLTTVLVESISVIGPRILRPYGSYKVAIAGGARAHNLYVAVEGRKANGEQYTQGKEALVQPGTSRIVELEIGDPGPGQYALVSRSTSGPLFSSSAPLVYQPRSFCVFVQTDKRVYQPGDNIIFNVVALDKYLLPLTGNVDITLMDSGGSPIYQWPNVALDRGIITQQLALADEPALGEWTIQVDVRGQIYSKHILVADYVPPKFQMDMQMPKEILFSDGSFKINVTAKHFNGLPVKGELTISANAVFFSGLLQPVFSSPARKVVEFNGHADVTYDLKTDLDLAEDAARPLIIEAVLQEKDTLIKQNVSSRILLLRTPYRLKVTAAEIFKPNLPYNVQIEVVNASGQLMETDEDVTVERLWDDGAPMNSTNVNLKKGLATYSLMPDTAHTNSTLNLVIKYKEVSERVINVQSGKGTGSQYLTIVVLTRETGVRDEMRAKITSTEPLDLIHYAIIGRGEIQIAKTLELSPPRRSVEISAPVTPAMAPGCILLAWYPRLDTNTLLSSAVYIPHRDPLQNKVSVTVTGGYRPGGGAEVVVRAEAGSQAITLGTDAATSSVGLAGVNGLGSGLDMHTIEREVESFNGLKHSLFKNEEHLPGMGLDLGGKMPSDVFKNAGVVILTDGVLVNTNSRESSDLDTPESGTRPPLAGPYAFSRLPPPPSPRFYLSKSTQPTWLHSNFSIGNEGSTSENRLTPMSSGEWTIGAFAVHPTQGLGLAPPQKLNTNVPLAITAELPATLQKGEVVAAIIILKSTLTVDASVEVTFHNSEQYFEFEPLENNIDSTKKIELFRRARLTVPARGQASTAFLVSAVRTGEAPVIVEASGNSLSASMFRTIDVKDGFSEAVESWALIDARESSAKRNVSLWTAAGVRLGAGSLRAAGDLAAPALNSLKEMKPIPASDPPQALYPLAIATILLDYLQATDRDEVAITNDARAHVSSGFQRLMAFRRPDGSFAQEIDGEGDVWMTSVALTWLSRSARYIPVGPVASQGAAKWLVNSQNSDGSWDSPKVADNPNAQAKLPLTADALIALIQTQGSEVLHKNAINKAINYVASNLSPNLDAYTLSTIAHALSLAKHPQGTLALEYMDKYANSTGPTLFWSRRLSGSEWRNPWLRDSSLEAATASRALSALVLQKKTQSAGPVAAYLLQAGASSPQPIALDALLQFAEITKTASRLRLSVNVTGSDDVRQFSIDDDNSLILQTQLIRNIRSALVSTEGRGIAIVGLQAKGNTNVTAPWPRYTLDPRVDQISTSSRLQLSICIGFVPSGNETESGLVLMTVQLPSGYLADINTITELTSARHVVSARVWGGGSRVTASLRARLSEQCATLGAPRASAVARQRSGYVTLRDLYDSSHQARMFFQPIPTHSCDICRSWESCSRACGSAAQQLPSDGKQGTSAKPNSAYSTVAATTSLLIAIGLLLTIR